MKIRNGFVSNSSSSSFIVAFPAIPHNIDEVLNLLLLDKGGDRYHDTYNNQLLFSNQTIASTVFNDMKDEMPKDLKCISQIINNGHIEGQPSYDCNMKFGSSEYKAYEKKLIKWGRDYAKKFINKNKGCVFYKFSYADENGEFYGMMEHSGIFEALPYIRVSNH